MKIYSTPLFSVNQTRINPKKDSETTTVNPSTEEPAKAIAYRPVNFTSRLFRTPENFYEQDFNMNGMPKTMKDYLMDDFSDRRHMPPSEMMKLVFGDLEEAKSLEEVREKYPNEPLFAELKEPSTRVRTNIIGGLQVLQDGVNNEALFKNGDNNLGLYILKKIYLEGKTLKEINSDFAKDAQGIYTELLPQIDYATLKHFGIKFPERAFWHSFYSNRDNFPYTYTPRKEYVRDGRVIGAGGLGGTSHSTTQEYKPKRKYTLKEKELEDISKTLIEEQGNIHNSKKALRKSLDKETSNFIFDHLSQIMSIATDRINLSERMEEFYATKGYHEIPQTQYLEMTKRQGALMKEFWKLNPALRDHFSNAIKDTIELFTEEYAENGNNERFRALMEYADGIKPKREQLKLQHAEKQKYYDDLFRELDSAQKLEQDIIKEGEDLLGMLSRIINGSKHTIDIHDFNRRYFKLQYSPFRFNDSLFNFASKHPLTERMGSMEFDENGKNTKMYEKLYDYYKIIYNDFSKEKTKAFFGAKYTLYEMFGLKDKGFTLEQVFNMDPNMLDGKIGEILGHKPLTVEQIRALNERYDEILKDKLSPQELQKIARKLVDDVLKIDKPEYEHFSNLSPKIKEHLIEAKTVLTKAVTNTPIFKDFSFLLRKAYSEGGNEVTEFLLSVIRHSIKI